MTASGERSGAKLSVLVHLLFLVSGAAGIGYQMIWIRQFAVGLGHEAPSTLAVVAGFFGGLGLGAWVLDRAVSRSARPGAWYALLELVIGVWGAATATLIPFTNDRTAALIGLAPSPARHWLVAFAVPLIVMLPATAAMGATLPAVDRFVERLRGSVAVGGLYGANTLGAMSGALLATFGLVPAFGLRRSLYVLAAMNFACAIVTWRIARAADIDSDERPKAAASAAHPKRSRAKGKAARAPARPEEPAPGSARLYATLFATGALGVGYEILAVLAMSQVLQDTIYTYAIALAVFLCGTALGAALQPWFAARRSYAVTLRRLLGSLASGCLLGTLALAAAPRIHDGAAALFGAGYAGSLAAEAATAVAVLFLPTIAMGATFAHLCVGARGGSGGVGAALGINTAGGFLAPFVFGIVLLPILGPKAALLILSLSYLLLLPGLDRSMIPTLAAAAALSCGVLLANLDHVDPPPGGATVELRTGVMGAVGVVADAQGHRFLKVNNHFQMGGTATTFPDRRLMLLPMLLHRAPHRALVLGVGTGVTIGEVRADPDMRTDGVELVGDILEVMHHFEPENQVPQRIAGMRILTADARRFVRASHDSYDVIVGDLFHPARDGAGSLYTIEHFAAIKTHLTPGGLFVQWLPLYQMDLGVFSVVGRTFLEAFPDAHVIVAHFNAQSPIIGLLGTAGPVHFPLGDIDARLRPSGMHAAAQDLAIQSAADVLGCFIADAGSLRAFADAHSSPSDINTDDRPIVTLRAPRYAYASEEPPYHRLQALLTASSIDAETLTGDHDSAEPLRRFWRARDLYLSATEAGAASREGAWSLLLESVRTSRDFRPAYAQVLDDAVSMAAHDRPAAIALLDRLIQADPTRPEALTLQRRILEGALR